MHCAGSVRVHLEGFLDGLQAAKHREDFKVAVCDRHVQHGVVKHHTDTVPAEHKRHTVILGAV